MAVSADVSDPEGDWKSLRLDTKCAAASTDEGSESGDLARKEARFRILLKPFLPSQRRTDASREAAAPELDDLLLRGVGQIRKRWMP
jgi:hypothetical protein